MSAGLATTAAPTRTADDPVEFNFDLKNQQRVSLGDASGAALGSVANPFVTAPSVAGRAAFTATIANGASLSGAVDLGEGRQAAGIVMPAAWTAADLTYQVSLDNVTFQEFKDNILAPVQHAVAAADSFSVDWTLWGGWRYIKVRSGTSGAAVNQGGSRAIIITTVPL